MSSLALIILFAEGDAPWWDYPGFELWKFVNLTLFLIAGFVLLRRPIASALQARRESIGRALIQARKERDEALKQLAEVETRLAGLDEEVAAIRERSQLEAAAESERIRKSTESELSKLRESARREVDATAKSVTAELRRFASEESIRTAGQFISSEITSEDDARITKERAQRLGGAAH